MPENIFRNIFFYLEEHEIYFNLRNVCRQLRLYSGGYVKLDAKFLLLHGEVVLPCSSGFAWMLYIFTLNRAVTSLYWKPLSLSHIYPKENKKYNKMGESNFTIAHFGSVSNGSIIAGSFILSRWNEFELLYRTIVCYEYNQCDQKWLRLSPTNPECSHTRIGVVLANFSIEDLHIIFHQRGMVILKLLKQTKRNVSSDFSSLTEIEVHDGSQEFEVKNIDYNFSELNFSLLFSCATVTPITKRKFIIFGPNPVLDFQNILVNDISNRQVRETFKEGHMEFAPMMKLLEGVLSENENSVKWREIEINEEDVDSSYFRLYPICFKLKDDLFIAGGFTHDQICTSMGNTLVLHKEHSTCGRYNLADKEFYPTNYVWPLCRTHQVWMGIDYPYNRNHDILFNRVVTNIEETLAVILIRNDVTCNPSNNCIHNDDHDVCQIVFTTDRGFEIINRKESPYLPEGFVLTRI